MVAAGLVGVGCTDGYLDVWCLACDRQIAEHNTHTIPMPRLDVLIADAAAHHCGHAPTPVDDATCTDVDDPDAWQPPGAAG